MLQELHLPLHMREGCLQSHPLVRAQCCTIVISYALYLQELHLALYLGDASLQAEVLSRCRQAGPACSPAPQDLMGLVEQHGALPDVSRQAHLLALDHLLGMGSGMPGDLVALVSC